MRQLHVRLHMYARAWSHLLHCCLEQANGDLHGHNGPFLDVLLDELPDLAPFALLLGAEEVPRAEVDKVLLVNELGALRALARAWPAEDVDDGDVGRVERGLLAVVARANRAW
jgi:hypothetical protein